MDRKEAIEIVKKNWPYGRHQLSEALETLIPELKESEDENIRKAIHIYLDWLNGRKDYTPRGKYSIGDMISWLEKQGEQTLANSEKTCKVEPKFKVGDIIVDVKPNGYCPPVRVKYIDKGAYSCESDDGKRFLSFPIISQDKYILVEETPITDEWLIAHGFVQNIYTSFEYDLVMDDGRTEIHYYRSGGEPDSTMSIHKNIDLENEVCYELPEPYTAAQMLDACELCGIELE